MTPEKLRQNLRDRHATSARDDKDTWSFYIWAPNSWGAMSSFMKTINSFTDEELMAAWARFQIERES